MGSNTNKTKALVLKAIKFTLIEGESYRLRSNEILRRCVPMSARLAVMKETRVGDAGGHFSSEITHKKILQVQGSGGSRPL